MDLRDNIMTILNGRLQGNSCSLNKIEAERHRRLINIVDKIWDEQGLKGRDARNSK